MAISYVGVSNAVADASGNFTLVTTGISGLQEGDLLIAFVAMRGTAAVTLPSGGEWTQVWQDNGGNTSTTASTAIASGLVAYCVRGSSDPNLAFTRTGGDVALGRIIALRGVDTASPIRDWAANVGYSGSNSSEAIFSESTINQATISATSDWLVAAALGADNTSFSTADGFQIDQVPSTFTLTERADSNTTTGADTTLAIYTGTSLDTGAIYYASVGSVVESQHIGVCVVVKEAPPVDALTATGIASGTPSVGTPSLGQTHALTATGVSAGAPSVDTPALGQVHALGTPANVATGSPSVGSPALTEIHVLTATGIASGTPEVGSPALTQVHDLAADGLDAGTPTVGTTDLSQVHDLAADGIATGAPNVGSPATTQVHALAAGGVETGSPSVGAPALSENETPTDNLLADGTAAGSLTVGSPTLAQIHALIANGIDLGPPTVGSPVLAEGGTTPGLSSKPARRRRWRRWQDAIESLQSQDEREAQEARDRLRKAERDAGQYDAALASMFADAIRAAQARSDAEIQAALHRLAQIEYATAMARLKAKRLAWEVEQDEDAIALLLAVL